MERTTGNYRIATNGQEQVRAFVPYPLPPADPPLEIIPEIQHELDRAMAGISRLSVAADLVPNADWLRYGFVRKEALITSQIEGTQATLQDVLTFEAGEQPERPDDVQDVCNYVAALDYCRREMSRPKGLPLASRLLCEAHKRLMKGARGSDKLPGEIRTSQNWIGGGRPGNARFVPPPPQEVREALSSLEKWIHREDDLPPLVRAGLAHVQFETIHPFLDGNGRIGRLLITLLVEHWGLLKSPLLYLSVAFKRHRAEYYEHLSRVRTHGDWEGWTRFFLQCVTEAADDAVSAARQLFNFIAQGRKSLMDDEEGSMHAMRLFDLLPANPVITLNRAIKLMEVSKPTAIRSLALLRKVGILKETTGKQRDRIYTFHRYLRLLTPDTE